MAEVSLPALQVDEDAAAAAPCCFLLVLSTSRGVSSHIGVRPHKETHASSQASTDRQTGRLTDAPAETSPPTLLFLNVLTPLLLPFSFSSTPPYHPRRRSRTEANLRITQSLQVSCAFRRALHPPFPISTPPVFTSLLLSRHHSATAPSLQREMMSFL